MKMFIIMNKSKLYWCMHRIQSADRYVYPVELQKRFHNHEEGPYLGLLLMMQALTIYLL